MFFFSSQLKNFFPVLLLEVVKPLSEPGYYFILQIKRSWWNLGKNKKEIALKDFSLIFLFIPGDILSFTLVMFESALRAAVSQKQSGDHTCSSSKTHFANFRTDYYLKYRESCENCGIIFFVKFSSGAWCFRTDWKLRTDGPFTIKVLWLSYWRVTYPWKCNII